MNKNHSMMKKNILKVSLVAFIGVGAMMNAQKKTQDELRGRFGLNTEEPEVTVDLRVADVNVNTNRPEGILIPSVTRERAAIMGTDVPNSTMLYITEATTGTQTNTTINVDAKGFYYYDTDTNTWVKLNAGGGSVATTNNIRSVSSILSDQWAADDYTIIMTASTGELQLPNPVDNKGRIIVVRNGLSTSKSYTGTWVPTNNSALRGNAGNMLQSDGTQWWNISSF